MYLFICNGTPQHTSYSASKEQYDPSCPTCGAPTRLVEPNEPGLLAEDHGLTAQQLFGLAENLKERGYSETSIANIMRLEITEYRALMAQARKRYLVQMGKKFRAMRGEGKSNLEIAEALGVSETAIRTVVESESANEMTIWFPVDELYKGREGDYAKTVGELPNDRVVELVQQRVEEDGVWAIENHLVGDNEAKMRMMMAWASDVTNIAQCLEHLYKEENAHIRTVDWVCRDLANASKWIAGGIARD